MKSIFVLANYSGVWGLPWMWLTHQWHSIGKNCLFFSFLRGYQLQIAFCLEVGPCFLLLLSSTAVLCSLNLYGSYAYDHSLWGHIGPIVSGKCCLLEIVYHFWRSESFCALFFLDIWGTKSLIKTYLGLSALKSLSHHILQMWTSVLFTINYKK